MKLIVRSILMLSVRNVALIIAAGLTYCAIATLSCLNQAELDSSPGKSHDALHCIDLEKCIRWMTSRQTLDIDDDEDEALASSLKANEDIAMVG